jgi:predicted transcriptional regulator
MLTHTDILDWIKSHSKPFVTAEEVSSTWDCDEQTLLGYLYELVKRGELETESVHNRIIVWPAD